MAKRAIAKRGTNITKRINISIIYSLCANGKFFTDKIIDYLYLAFVKCC
jgi:hypothetical protein